MLMKCFCRVVFDSFKVLSRNQSLRWNHYKSLGLSPSASMSEVKAAYYKLSKIHHPDRNNGSEASAKKFRDIVAAYEVLGKEDSRKKYDREIVSVYEREVMRHYETRNSDFGQKKERNKRVKKVSNAPKMKTHIKGVSQGKWKQKYSGHKTGGGEGKSLRKATDDDFEAFIVRAIPFVVACLMCCKKR